MRCAFYTLACLCGVHLRMLDGPYPGVHLRMLDGRQGTVGRSAASILLPSVGSI